MNSEAISKDFPKLKLEAKKLGDAISAAQAELEELDRKRELAKADLKNTQTLKDPLITNYDLRIRQKEKELQALDTDIKVASITRLEVDEAMADRLETGRHAIENAQKFEETLKSSIRILEQKEKSILQNIANLQRNQEQESSALTLLKETVVSLRQEQDRINTWLLDKEVLIRTQETLEQKEKDLNAGRDYLLAWEKEVENYERDLKVMDGRLTPEYIAVFGKTNPLSKYARSYTERERLPDSIREPGR